MADRPPPRIMEVIGSRRISPSMLRVTLGGQGMVGFPPGQQGGYVKLMLTPQGSDAKPVVRTFTIRHQRNSEMDVDFALHSHGPAGPALHWALNAKSGDTLALGGPGPAKPLKPDFDYYLVAGDMTALPAISVNLEALPRDSIGFAAIEIQSEEDRQMIDAPAGIDIRWVINPDPGTRPELLEEAVRAWSWPAGEVYAWAACEFPSMRRLRTYLRDERGLDAGALYASSYWKSGLAEEAHKLVKREDAEAVGA